MTKLKELQRLHKKTEINFEIKTLWDGPHNFKFQEYYENEDYYNKLWKKSNSFDDLEAGIDWLIRQYKNYEEDNGIK